MKNTTFVPKKTGDRVKNLEKASPNFNPESFIHSTLINTVFDRCTTNIKRK